MDDRMFVDLVRKMRSAQTQYFKARSREALIESKRLEKLVDTHLRHVEMAERERGEDGR